MAQWGYPIDYVEGQFNMNEEWFGICAKGYPDEAGHFDLYPRAAYYLLKDAYTLDPYAEGITQSQIHAHFDALSPYSYDRTYKSHLAVAKAEENSKGNISDLRIEMTTIAAGNSDQPNPGFDHMESFYVDFLAQPNDAMRAEVSFNILGHVPENRVDRLFYERGENGTRLKTSMAKRLPSQTPTD